MKTDSKPKKYIKPTLSKQVAALKHTNSVAVRKIKALYAIIFILAVILSLVLIYVLREH